MRARKYTYIPNSEIESITTWNGKEIPGSKLLDGAYARGKVQYGEGGEMDKFGDEYWIIVKTPKGLVTKKDFYGMGYNKKEIIEWCEERGWIYNEKGEEFGGQALEEYEFFLKKPTKYDIQLPKSKMADGGMMAKGGGGVMPEWAVTITSDSGETYDWRGFAKNEDAAVHKAEMEAGFESAIKPQTIGGVKLLSIPQQNGGCGISPKYSKIKKEYEENEDENAHSENVVLLAKHFGIYSKDGYVKSIRNADGKLIKEIVNGGKKYRYNSVYKTYNSVEGNELLHKTTYADGGMMAKGGYTSRHRKRTLEEKAQEMYGSDWFDLDERTRQELIDDLRITKGAKGLMVGNKYVATFTLDNGKAITKTYSTKDELDEGIGEMYSDYDVIDVKIEETKVKEEPKEEEKKGLFKLAKITEKTTPKAKEKRQGVAIDGIESDISRYEELKAIMKNAKAESDLIGGRIKEVGSQKWLELYEQSGTNPNSINLIDGDETIMLQVKDAYKKVEPEKKAILQENYPDLVETIVVFTFNDTLLDKYGEVVFNLIKNSKEIAEQDKENLIKGESTTKIKKGSIDKILNYPNPEEVFILIEPTMALS